MSTPRDAINAKVAADRDMRGLIEECAELLADYADLRNAFNSRWTLVRLKAKLRNLDSRNGRWRT